MPLRKCPSSVEGRAIHGLVSRPTDFSSITAGETSSDCGLKKGKACESTPPHSAADVAEALRKCGKNKTLREGRHVHSQIIIRYGHHPIPFLGNCLVQMYGLCGSMQDAQKAFDRIHNPNHISWTILIKAYSQNGDLQNAKTAFSAMPHPDVVSWNAIISACAQNGHSQDAIDLFVKMQLHGPKPSNVTFVCVLDACADIQTGHAIHDAIIKFQYETDVTVGNALITMYGKCSSTHDANRTFLGMTVRNVVTWSALIAAYVHDGQDKDALQIFHVMLLDNIQPNNITCVSILDACSSLGDLGEGRKIHAVIVDCGYEKNVPVGNALVNMLGKCRSLPDARNVFSRMGQRNVVTWSALMGACAQNDCCKEVLHLFHQMQSDDIKPDKVTFLCVLDACTSLTTLKTGQVIHAAIVENGYEHEVMLGNALINFYGKCGSLPHARSVFTNLSARNVVSWSTMIAICDQNGHGKEALDLYYQMQVSGINPNVITLVCVVEACTITAEGQILHYVMVCNGHDQNATVGTALVNMYDKFGNFHDAKKVFDRVTQQDVISWTSVIAACAHAEHGKEALDLFYQMQRDGFKPNNVTFVCVLDACSTLAALEEGKEVHTAIIDSGFDDDGVVVNALINMYGKCGNVYDAIRQFSVMHQRDLVSWNAVLSGCAQNGCAQEALHLFNQMRLTQVKPDGVTFVCILTACSHAGCIEDGVQHFISLSTCYGSLLTEEHFACMIDLCGRAGQLVEAEQLIKFVPFKQVMSALTSLLGACKIHGDVERGLWVAKNMLDLNPQNVAPYVDLSNIFATAGTWG